MKLNYLIAGYLLGAGIHMCGMDDNDGQEIDGWDQNFAPMEQVDDADTDTDDEDEIAPEPAAQQARFFELMNRFGQDSPEFQFFNALRGYTRNPINRNRVIGVNPAVDQDIVNFYNEYLENGYVEHSTRQERQDAVQQFMTGIAQEQGILPLVIGLRMAVTLFLNQA